MSSEFRTAGARGRRGLLGAIALLLAIAEPAPRAQEAKLLLDTADGRRELVGATSIEVRGLAGTVALRVGRSGELRYASRLLDNRREEASVELWLDGSTLTLVAPEADRDTRRLVEITIPPELSTRVALDQSIVRVNGLQGDLEVVGRELDLDARGLLGAVTIEATGGKVTLVGVDAGLDLRASGTEVRVEHVSGVARLHLRKCHAEVVSLIDDVELDIEETELTLDQVQGVVEAQAYGGKLDMRACRGGATVRLEGTSLILAESEGVVEVDTDASVDFRNLRGPLTVRGYGASVRGGGSTAHVDVETSDAEVHIEGITGPVSLRGDGLRAQLSGLRNAVHVETQSSEIVLEDLAGAAEIRNDYGNVTVRKATQQVDVTASGGEVVVEDQSGPLKVDADGPRVAVAWAELSQDKDSTVINRGGGIDARFPVGGNGCAIVAQSEYGSVVSSIPGLDVAPGATSLQGSLRNTPRPKVELNAGGDIRLELATGQPR